MPRISQLQRVHDAIRDQVRKEHEHLNSVGRGMQMEGYVGGYLQALSDVELARRGIVPNNSRFAALWEKPGKQEPTP